VAIVNVLAAALGLVVALAIGASSVSSILADAAMLVEAGGWWMHGLYGVVPTLVWLHSRGG
jgi:hypothetical protein